MAVPITCNHVLVTYTCIYTMDKTYLSNIGSNNRRLSEHVQSVIEPRGQMSLTILRQIHARHRAKLDAQRLQKDGENVGKQDHEEETEAERRSGRHVGCIVSYQESPLVCILSGIGEGREYVPGSIYATETMKPGPINLKYFNAAFLSFWKPLTILPRKSLLPPSPPLP
jgi:hypothetical protein